MKYLKSLFTVLLVSLTFTACNEFENFDADSTKVNYPKNVPFGFYESEYTADSDYEYGVVYTKNTAGDTVLQVIMTGREGTADAGSIRTIAVCENATYDDTLGMLVANCDYSFFEDELMAVIAYNRNGGYTLQIQHGSEKKATRLKASNNAPSFISKWASDELVLSLTQEAVKDENGNVALEVTGAVAFAGEEEATEIDSYVAEGATATVKVADKTLTLALNSDYQLVVTMGNKTYTCNRMTNDPEPENFEAIAAGSYTHGVSVIDGGAVFTDKYDAYLYQSDKDPNRYVIYPWLSSESGLLLVVDPATLNVTVPQCYTGLDDKNYGPVFGIDVMTYTGGQINSPSTFNPQTLTFDLSIGYVVSAGYFGLVKESYIATDYVTETAKKTAKKLSPKSITLNEVKLQQKTF
jgi:hypothetical protein